MKTKALLFLLLTTLSAGAEHAAESDGSAAGPRLSLAEVTSDVLARNPAVREALQKWEAAKQRVTQEKAWDDLKISANSTVARFVNISPNGFTDQSLALEQSIPISGKNRSRARVAAAEAVVAFESVRRQELDVLAQARASYFRLANACAQIALNQKNYTSLTQIAEINRSRYEVGTQSAADVLSSETEAARLLETRRDLERDLAQEQSRLNLLMNRDAFAPVGQPNESTFSPSDLSIDKLRALTLDKRPEVRTARALIDADKAKLQLARRAWIPDPAISAQGQRYNDTGQALSEVGAGVSFSIPWGNYRKYSARVSEATANLAGTQAARDRAEKEAIGALRDSLQKVETAHHHVEVCRDQLVPRAQQAFEASQFAYESGKGAFGDWIAAQRTLRDLDAEARQHLTEYQIALTELEAVVGADLHTFPAPPNRIDK